ncbi:MAG: histidinol dehydrogenase [Rhodospirillales bacterium RIFCSPLOWO2_12_FULL_58_28]|nr:MAG: histidinol dehydrogenase [Rhodospirillales bacterium RIFCSPLOWO2_02_FULL_58_16]OHC78518.1 MAG: histidinol dehydrogenase [Rhodospirillales bacterium RIFCSPLOWO2_12_FULL_58_28]
MPKILDVLDPGFHAGLKNMLAARREADEDIGEAVRSIIADVRENGDEALIALTARFDGFAPTARSLRVTAEELEQAAEKCEPGTIEALKIAAARIADFHRRQLPEDMDYVDDQGVRLGLRWKPMSSVGIYVPGGAAAYPSSVLMNAIPARTAGVERLAMATPTPGGVHNPLVLAAAHLAGVDEVYSVGGAQAIAALAYGTKTIPAVHMIAGPGNAYVTEAKRQMFGIVGIDMIAGPSEILVVADNLNDPAWIAADLLSQAEHDAASQSILVSDDRGFADRVCGEVERLLAKLPRASIAGASWRDHGCVIIVNSFTDIAPIIDLIAPEHLELAIDDADELAARLRHAGAVFLGRYTPEAIGDYMAGPSHVLPTARSARFSSGLGVLTFMKRSSLIGCDAESLAAIGPYAATLAEAEGLDAHAMSVALRLDRNRR